MNKTATHFKTSLLAIGIVLFFLVSFERTSAQASFNVSSSHGYTVHVNLTPGTVVATTSCAYGYNYQVYVNYTISFSGTNIPASLWVMQGNIGCEAGSHFFQLPETAGSGSSLSGNGYSYHCHCAQTNAEILGCNTIYLTISGPGIAYQTISANYDYGTPTNPNEFVWTGAYDSNWFNTLNWQNGTLPNYGADIVVATSGNNPYQVSGNICLRDITIMEGSTVTFADNNANVRVTGDFINHGTFEPKKGRVSFESGIPQTIGGSAPITFHNLRINTYSKVTLENDVELSGFMSPDLGTFDMNGHLLKIYSDADMTGAIGQIKNSCTILGDSIEYNRFFPSGSGNWRMLSSPITDATYEQWNDDIPTTGFPGSDYPNYPSAANPWSNIRVYDGTTDNAFESIEGISSTIPAGVGHFVYFIPSGTTIDMTGTFKRGNHTWTRSNPSPGLNANNGWHMLGNPYPCPIDWDKAGGWSKSGISNAVYAFDPSTGQYSSYVNGISTGKMNGKIESLQAFWVKTSGENLSITVNESAKATVAGVMLRSTDANTESLVRVILNGEDDQPWDDCVVGFNYLASEDFDEAFDAYKMYATDANIPGIAIYADTLTMSAMSISTFPVPNEETIINLLVRPGNRTTFSLENGMVDTFEENLCLKLLDRETDEIHSFNLGEKIEFTKGEMDLRHRFALVVTAPTDLAVVGESCPNTNNGAITAQGYGEAPWTFTWTDEMGGVIKTTENATVADKIENLSPGFYTVEITNNAQLCNSAVEVVQITAAETPSLETTATPESCNNSGNGEIALVQNDTYSYQVTVTNNETGTTTSLQNIAADTVLTHLPAGIYTLTASNGCADQEITRTLNLRDPNAVSAAPSAMSQTADMQSGGVIAFINNSSSNCTQYRWEFGDGQINTVSTAPQHAYQHWGTYNVKLIASNEMCSDTTSMTVQITGVAANSTGNTNELLADLQEDATPSEQRSMDIKIVDNQLQIAPGVEIQGQVSLKINTITGQLVMEKTFTNLTAEQTTIDISGLDQGLYTYGLHTDKQLLGAGEFTK